MRSLSESVAALKSAAENCAFAERDCVMALRDLILLVFTLALAVVGMVELSHMLSLGVLTYHTANAMQPTQLVGPTQNSGGASGVGGHRNIAIAIFSVHRPKAPDYVYLEVMSILDTMLGSPYVHFDKIHVFDGSLSGSQVRFFKYSPHVQVHPMDRAAFRGVERFAVHRKASLNYLLALEYMVPRYADNVDAILMLEDDVIFDPRADRLLWGILGEVRRHDLFLVDGYYRGGRQSIGWDVVVPFGGAARCCSQAFLMSPRMARESIDIVRSSLNGSARYEPLDLFLTSAWLRRDGFRFFFAATCFVQHIGYPTMGLGEFHRGCSRMRFDADASTLQLDMAAAMPASTSSTPQ